MGLIASSILVKYSLLNSSGSLIYAGSSSNSLRLWGAQLELAEYSDQILDNFINHFRYTRTTGIEANFISTRLGYGYAPDSILIGGSSGTRSGMDGLENTALYLNKYSQRGVDTGTGNVVTISNISSLAITSGLAFFIDASQTASYSGVNNVWRDLSSNAYPAYVYGNSTFITSNNIGIFANTLQFNSTSNGQVSIPNNQLTGIGYVSVPSIPDSFWQSSWSVSAWVNFNLVNRSQAGKAPDAFGQWDNSIVSHGFGSSNAGLHLHERGGRAYFGLYANDYYGSTDLSANTWYNITWTYNRPLQQTQIYLNGTAETLTYTGSTSGAYVGTGNNTAIGLATAFLPTVAPMNGQISKVAFYNRVLNSSEVALNYAATAPAYSSYTVVSSTNLLINSQNILGGGWGSAFVNVTSGLTANYQAPDGSYTAFQLTDTSPASDLGQFSQTMVVAPSSSNAYTLSLYVKKVNYPQIDLYAFWYTGGNTRGVYMNYNFDTDTIRGNYAETFSVFPYNIGRQVLSNGWVRIYMTAVDVDGRNQTLEYRIYPTTRDYPISNNLVGSVLVWGPQVTQVSYKNLALYSTNVGAAAWATGNNLNNVPLIAATYAPDGNFTADGITFWGPAGGGSYRYQYFNTGRDLTGQIFTFSAWVWSSSAGKKIGLRIDNQTNGGDQSASSLTLTTTPTRYTISRAFNSATQGLEIGFDNRAALGGDDTTGVVYIWGTQLEQSTFASPLLRTSSTVATSYPTVSPTGIPFYIGTTASAITYAPVSSGANLFLYSNTLNNSAGWTTSFGTISSTLVTAPDGTNTAYQFTESGDGSLNQHLFSQNIGTVSVGQPYTFSAYLKAVPNTPVRLVSLTYNGGGYPLFDLVSGTVVTAGNFSSASITAVGNGWYRCTVQGAAFSVTGAFYIIPFTSSISAQQVYSGNGQSGFYVWHPQLTSSITQQNFYVATTSAIIGYQAATSVVVGLGAIVTSNVIASTSYTLTTSILTDVLTGADYDRVYTGQAEKLTFNTQFNLRDTEAIRTDLRNIPSAAKYDAQAIMGINVARKTAVTFDLNQYQPLTGDNIYYNALDWFSEAPRSRRARKSVGAETAKVFINKQFDETKFIPRIKKLDALRVMGLEPINKTSSTVDLARYTPLRSSDVTYYKSYDWYSLTPRSQYAKLAYGIGDGSPYITDNMQFIADGLLYAETKAFYEIQTMGFGASTQTSRLAGRTDPETMNMVIQSNIKRGVYREITIDNQPFTSSDAATIMDAFVNRTNRTWYQLTPYYSDNRYSRIRDGEGGADNVRVGGYWAGIRVSSSDQEKLSITLVQSPRSDSSTATEYLTKYDTRIARAGAAINQTVVRTNKLLYSETLTNSAWTTTGATVLSSLTTLSPSLAYRSVVYDADQLADVLVSSKNNYYGRRWYLITPLATRTAFSSSGIAVVIPSSSNTQHGISTTVINTDGTDNWFSLGMYVNTSGGITRVRLDAGVQNGIPHSADFDLSSQAVLTSTNVNFAAVVPQGNNWYLVKIMGPVDNSMTSSYDVRGLAETISIKDNLALNSALFNLGNTDLQVLFGTGDLNQQDNTEDLLI